MKRNVYIYALCDPLTKEVRYVGKSVNPKLRFNKHLLRKENNRKHSWIISLKNKGFTPEMEILDIVLDSNDEDWQHLECWWISYFSFLGARLTNLNGGGQGGILPSMETRLKQSLSHIGNVLSQEARFKISQKNKGKKKPLGFSEKLRKANLGKTHSKETRRKLSESSKKSLTKERQFRMCVLSKTPEALEKMRKGVIAAHKKPEVAVKFRKAYDDRMKPLFQLDKDGNILGEFRSTLEAAKAVKGNASHIGSCAAGRKYFKTASGFYWKFKENYEARQRLTA